MTGSSAFMTGVVWVALVSGSLGCAEERPVARVRPETLRQHEDFDARLRKIAQDYRSWPRVSDLAQWEPELGRPPQVKAGIRMSDSDDFSTHGHKLYYLHAQDQAAYVRLAWGELDGAPATSSPTGQAIVKESWFAEPVKGAMVPFAGYGVERSNSDSAHGPDGREYRAGAKGDLFIMFKLDPMTPNTDNGWVYGTTSPDGSVVTSVGMVQSCITCHSQAPHERLFGVR